MVSKMTIIKFQDTENKYKTLKASRNLFKKSHALLVTDVMQQILPKLSDLKQFNFAVCFCGS